MCNINTDLINMKQMVAFAQHIVIMTTLSILLIGCGSGNRIFPDYRGYEREEMRTSIKRTPGWVESARVLWYDDGSFYVVGKAFNRTDIGFAEAEGKAFAAKNIAEQIQTIFNSRLSLAMESEGEDIDSYSRLLLSMITQNIPLSISTTEVYWEQYRSPRGLRYDVYTLNRITEGSVRYAVSDVMRQMRNQTATGELRDKLREFEEEIIRELKR